MQINCRRYFEIRAYVACAMREQMEIKKKKARGTATVKERKRWIRRRRGRKVNEERAKGAGWRALTFGHR